MWGYKKEEVTFNIGLERYAEFDPCNWKEIEQVQEELYARDNIMVICMST